MASYLLVADVLGFSNIVSNLSEDEMDERINAWISMVTEIKSETGLTSLQLVSDTVFAKEDDSEDGLKRLLRFSRLLLERGIENSFPVRGGIAYGHVTWGRLIYGRAVIDAYRLERSLDWIGIGCERLPNLPWSWDLICCYPVPRKAGPIGYSAAVVWTTSNSSLREGWGSSELFDARKGVTWENQSKIMNTILFLRYVREAKHSGFPPNSFITGVPSQLNVEI